MFFLVSKLNFEAKLYILARKLFSFTYYSRCLLSAGASQSTFKKMVTEFMYIMIALRNSVSLCTLFLFYSYSVKIIFCSLFTLEQAENSGKSNGGHATKESATQACKRRGGRNEGC